jgi:hypothetical protein
MVEVSDQIRIRDGEALMCFRAANDVEEFLH